MTARPTVWNMSTPGRRDGQTSWEVNDVDWTSIIMTLITSGAFTAIYLLGDRKTSAVLDNVGKSIDQWKLIVEEYKKEKDAMQEEIDRKDKKLDSLYNQIGVLRDSNDKLSSKVAYLSVIKCTEIGCNKRQPPFGSGQKSNEKQLTDGNDK